MVRLRQLPWAPGVALVLILPPLAAQAATTAPTAGDWYRVSGYVSAVTSGCGSGTAVGNTPSGRFYYAGPGATGSLLYLYKQQSTPGAPDVNRVSLPAMPSATATPVSGSFTTTKLLSGSTNTGSMTVTLNYGDANAFFMTLQSTTTNGSSSCTQSVAFTAIHSSK